MHPAIRGLVERMNPESWSDADRQAARRARREFDIHNTDPYDFPNVPQPLRAYGGQGAIYPPEWYDNPVPVSTELQTRVEGQPYFPSHDVPNPDANARWDAQRRDFRPLREQIGHDADLIDQGAGFRGQGAPRPLPQHTFVPEYPSYRSPKSVTSDASLSPQVGPTGMPEDIPSDWDDRHPWE